MSRTTESKSSTPEQRERLIEALLNSPLAAELSRSTGCDPLAVRQRAAELLEVIEHRYRTEVSLLEAKTTAFSKERDRLKAELAKADNDADTARNEVQFARERFARERTACVNLTTAGAEWLKSKGLDSRDAVDQYLLVRH
jgi:DNA uptake protein ComE-like DNA-binding protein